MQSGGGKKNEAKGKLDMILAELLDDLDTLGDDLTIYAEADPDWDASSLAIASQEPENGSLPAVAAGMKYFLEVAIAKDVLQVWREWRDGQEPTMQEKCEAVIYYALNDSYMPV
jgi:hypothetical protein